MVLDHNQKMEGLQIAATQEGKCRHLCSVSCWSAIKTPSPSMSDYLTSLLQDRDILWHNNVKYE